MLWVFDLDGVVWLAGRAIEGSAEADATCCAPPGDRVAFVTNNSDPNGRRVRGAPGARRCRDEAGGAGHLLPGRRFDARSRARRAAFVGGPGVKEALEERGVEIVGRRGQPRHRRRRAQPRLDFARLAAAAAAIRAGARFVATNTDATFPTPRRPRAGRRGPRRLPGGGLGIEGRGGRKAQSARWPSWSTTASASRTGGRRPTRHRWAIRRSDGGPVRAGALRRHRGRRTCPSSRPPRWSPRTCAPRSRSITGS